VIRRIRRTRSLGPAIISSFMLHTRTNNIMLFIHNSFGGLTSSQTMYTKPLFGIHTPTYTHTLLTHKHTYLHTLAYLRGHSSHTHALGRRTLCTRYVHVRDERRTLTGPLYYHHCNSVDGDGYHGRPPPFDLQQRS
jgi:hypothetical protein